jgi:TRAP-type uncharacterized transport system fused permease subunit
MLVTIVIVVAAVIGAVAYFAAWLFPVDVDATRETPFGRSTVPPPAPVRTTSS